MEKLVCTIHIFSVYFTFKLSAGALGINQTGLKKNNKSYAPPTPMSPRHATTSEVNLFIQFQCSVGD